MPKLWTETVDEHRRAVRDAALDATARLVTAHGLASVTMSQIAGEAGIGRATLYKYFPDLESVLTAWHERQVTTHLEHLSHIRDQGGTPRQQLQAVLLAYALMTHDRPHDAGLTAALHHGDHADQAHQQLTQLIEDLLAVASSDGVRDDIAPRELAAYCLHALAAATALPTQAAVRRLVAVTLDGLRPPR